MLEGENRLMTLKDAEARKEKHTVPFSYLQSKEALFNVLLVLCWFLRCYFVLNLIHVLKEVMVIVSFEAPMQLCLSCGCMFVNVHILYGGLTEYTQKLECCYEIQCKVHNLVQAVVDQSNKLAIQPRYLRGG